ncbi:ROK family protein [Novispirillum sp. DQ9]|uniref:ROK family protein n=1 Tax=Novispirillum sp. DQ9 TaxID=3398612 RepID=UPI003C7A2F08
MTLTTPDRPRFGIDLGGTKIEAIALDAHGRELARERLVTPRGHYDATIDTIRVLIEGLDARFGRGSVGVGIPGTVSPASGVVKNANSTWLIGQPLHRDLEAALGRPVRVANDADCLALSEATDGAAAGAAIAFAVILGTGVGGGVVTHGRVLTGPNAIGGEWGHNPLPWPRLWDLPDGRTLDERPGPLCYCGLQGCIETFLCGPGLTTDHHAATGATLPPQEIAARATQGDAACAASMDRYCDRLGRALSTVINILDPEVVVLGGGLSNIAMLYERIPALWARTIFSDTVATTLRPAMHGDSSGVRGAAWLWDQGEAVRSV